MNKYLIIIALIASTMVTSSTLLAVSDQPQLEPTCSNHMKEPYITIWQCSHKSLESNEGLRALLKIETGHLLNIVSFYGFPKETMIDCYVKRPFIKNKYEKKLTFKISDSGEIVIKGKRNQWVNENVRDTFISSRGFLPGEKIELLYKTGDEKFRYEKSFIPNPIRVESKSEKTILIAELIAFRANYECYKIDFSGIPENEKLTLVNYSETEKVKREFNYSRKNPMMIAPAEILKKGGVGKVSFVRESGEIITVCLPWGTELLGYGIGEKIYNPEGE